MNIDEISFYANDGIICDNDYIWYYANELSSVIQVEKRTGTTKVLFVIKEAFGSFSFRSIARFKDYIFVFPFRGDKYIKYDINSRTYLYKKIPNEIENWNWSARYFQDSTSLYFYFQPPFIVRFYLETEDWAIYKLEEFINGASYNDTKQWLGVGAFSSENYILFQFYNDNKLVRLNQLTGKISIIELNLPYEDSYIETMTYSEGGVWLVLNDRKGKSRIIKYDSIEFETYKEICAIENGELSKDRTVTFYSQIVVGRTYLWLLPFESDRVLKVSKDGNMMVTPEGIPVINRSSLKPVWGRAGNYNIGKMLNETYTNMHIWSNTIVEINIDNDNIVSFVPMSFDRSDIWEQANLDIIQENTYYSLKDFLIREVGL